MRVGASSDQSTNQPSNQPRLEMAHRSIDQSINQSTAHLAAQLEMAHALEGVKVLEEHRGAGDVDERSILIDERIFR